MTTTTPETSAPSRHSLSLGPALTAAPARLRSLATALRHAADHSPELGVRYLEADGTDLFQSYPELLTAAARLLGGLRAAGLRPGDKVIFQLQLNADFVPAFWACVLGGLVPVPISIPPGFDAPNSTLAKLKNAWSLLGAPLVLAGDALVAGLNGFARREGLASFRVLAISPLRQTAPARDWHEPQPNDLALLLLTSGSTGQPKGVQLTHHNLLARSAATVQTDVFGPHDISLNWMPLDHVGGLVMFHLRDVYAGCSQIQAATELVLQQPLRWLDWIERYRVSITWAPNFAFGLINDQAELMSGRVWALSSLRFILNGGEAIVSRTARRFLELLAPHGLPGTAMRPAWGMSETSSGVTSSHRFSLTTTRDHDPFVEVGGPLPGVALRIVDAHGGIAPEGVIGALQVSGRTVTRGYYQNPELNAQLFTADGWFTTGDLGLLRDGRLALTGREKDVIIINGVNFHGHEIEAVIEQIKGVEVSFTAACAVRVIGHDTDQLAVFYSAGTVPDLAELGRQMRARVLREIGVNIDHVIVLPKERIPKTAIGKIQRTELKQQFEAGDFAAPATMALAATAATTANPSLAGCFRREWRAEPLAPASPAPASAGAARIWVIVNDSAGLADHLRTELRARNETVFSVPLDATPADYDRVLAQVDCAAGQAGLHSAHVVDLGSFADPTAPVSLTAGAERLLGLAAALACWSGGEKPARLLVVSAGAQAVTPDEPVVAAHGALLGLLATLPKEIAGIDAGHLDLPFALNAEAARVIAAEASAPVLRGEVAWRGGRRFRSGLAALAGGEPESNQVAATATARATHTPAATLKPGGIYLVTGGLGGIGRALTENLLRRWQARGVVLTGREAETEFSPEKRAALTALQRLGAVAYEKADAADLPAMRAVWQRSEGRWGTPPDGVFHLAGTYHECGLADETAAGLRAAFQSKAGGAEVIGELVSAHPHTHVVLFSSLLGFFGGFQTGAYAAANHVLESFTWQQRQRGYLNVRCLLWSSWADRGMSRGLGDNVALRAKGFLSLSPEQGWDALVGILETTAPVVLIGLDAHNPQIAAYLSTEATFAGEAQICCDRAARVEPRDEVERKLVSIWKTLLKVPEVGVRDSFFELGGRSLLAARLFAKINQEFGQNLPLATLFTFSTIEQLATLLKGASSAASSGPRVITLQAIGSQAPLFCIPGRDANNLVYRDLVRPLGKDQPIFSLQAEDPADAEARARPLLIELCAERLVAQIRATRATGPYRISGHGFGAVLAWQVAQRLGAEVAQLVLLAPPPAAFFAPLGEPGGAPEARSVVFTSPPQHRLLRRLFTPLMGAGRSAIGRDWREGRSRYGELTLHSLSIPVAVFGFPENALPWRDLAPGGFSLHEEENLGAVLPALLARAPVRTQPASYHIAASTAVPRAKPAASPPSQPAPSELSLASRTACLLPIRKHGDAHPLFCIPGSGSDAIVFQDIATALGDNHPVYGLQARGLDARPVEGELPSVEEVAADFIATIRAVQPSGPYHLGGHCFGCLLAWEVAGQLRAQGEEVGVLALLDPIVSNVFSDGILGRDRVGYHLGKFHRLSAGEKLRYFTSKVRNFSRTLIVRRRLSQSYAMAREMHARYTLKTYDLPVVVFLAQDSFFKLAPERDPRRHFEKLCPRGVRYQEAEGDHHAILHPPGVAQVAAGLRPEISARN
jgi:acyl-CoA synthetase (AMP-forming)/AMP-acid ligase II/thioesterase domain-containing protein/NADP-dependent 3-hydroxy acid dehydrogenase YdfG/acyl carrier protein